MQGILRLRLVLFLARDPELARVPSSPSTGPYGSSLTLLALGPVLGFCLAAWALCGQLPPPVPEVRKACPSLTCADPSETTLLPLAELCVSRCASLQPLSQCSVVHGLSCISCFATGSESSWPGLQSAGQGPSWKPWGHFGPQLLSITRINL